MASDKPPTYGEHWMESSFFMAKLLGSTLQCLKAWTLLMLSTSSVTIYVHAVICCSWLQSEHALVAVFVSLYLNAMSQLAHCADTQLLEKTEVA